MQSSRYTAAKTRSRNNHEQETKKLDVLLLRF